MGAEVHDPLPLGRPGRSCQLLSIRFCPLAMQAGQRMHRLTSRLRPLRVQDSALLNSWRMAIQPNGNDALSSRTANLNPRHPRGPPKNVSLWFNDCKAPWSECSPRSESKSDSHRRVNGWISDPWKNRAIPQPAVWAKFVRVIAKD